MPERIAVSAYALCADRDGRVLLVRIAPSYPVTGAWTLPGGGLDFGEHPEAGVLRELEEETGLLGEITGLAGVDSRLYEPDETMRGDRVHAIRILYHVAIVGGELRHESNGSTDLAAWIAPDELAGLPVVDLVTWALQRRQEESTPRR
jgi:8-oxo-dGTP diphosphatase